MSNSIEAIKLFPGGEVNKLLKPEVAEALRRQVGADLQQTIAAVNAVAAADPKYATEASRAIRLPVDGGLSPEEQRLAA